MRVIAGSARRISLETVPGMETRPTTDRIKETLFNMLQPCLADCDFLDLFAGSGAIGIEALSRGARSAVFVEKNAEAIDCIRRNLLRTHLEERAVIARMDVIAGIQKAELEGSVFDLIFMDPPYRAELEKRVLAYLAQSRVVYADTQIIVEAALETDFHYIPDLGFEIVRVKQYKTNQHLFLRKKALFI